MKSKYQNNSVKINPFLKIYDHKDTKKLNGTSSICSKDGNPFNQNSRTKIEELAHSKSKNDCDSDESKSEEDKDDSKPRFKSKTINDNKIFQTNVFELKIVSKAFENKTLENCSVYLEKVHVGHQAQYILSAK